MLLTLMTVGARAKQDNVATDRLSVVTTVFPAYDFTRQIAGSAVSVSILLPPGLESHSFEPTPQDIIRMQHSALFICVGGESESWVDQVLLSMDTSRMRIIRMMDCVQTLERMADMISEETGSAKRLLHACHNISKRDFDQGRTYLELMEQNVINLREALS
jgi:zinc transport system substrate-binding protein